MCAPCGQDSICSIERQAFWQHLAVQQADMSSLECAHVGGRGCWEMGTDLEADVE